MKIHTSFYMFFIIVICGCVPQAIPDSNRSIVIEPTPVLAEPTATEKNPAPVLSAPDGWLTYEDDDFGFSFFYPPQFEILSDAESLSGWDNGILLLYNGGQSYDIAVQIWDSLEDAEAFYGGEDERLHIFPIGDQLLSVMNITNEADSDAIVESITIW